MLANGFKDSIEGPHKEDIMKLVSLGIIGGYTDGTFKSEAYVLRGEVSKYIFNSLKSIGSQGTELRDPAFTDVGKDSIYYGFIGYMQDNGIISGFKTGEYKPHAGVTRCHMAKIVDRSTELDSFKEAKVLGIKQDEYIVF